MKKSGFVLFFLATIIQFQLAAQNKFLTVADASWRNYNLFPAYVQNLQWMGNSDNYVYVKKNSVFKHDAKRGEEKILFSLDKLNKIIVKSAGDSLRRLPSMNFEDNNVFFSLKGRYYKYDFRENTIEKTAQIPDTARNAELCTKTGYVAYTIKNNFYVATDKENIAVTSDDNPGIVNGQIVSRNEFGINKGIFWSEQGDKVAFYRKDETGVSDYPLVDIDKRVAQVENIKYPMAGMTSEEVHLGIYDIDKKRTVFLKTGDNTDHYLTSVTWGPDGKYIYLAILNREQNHMWLNKYDAGTGEKVKTLFEESNPKYVEPEHPLYFSPFNKEHFIWISERDGWNHLYLYDTDGNLIRQVTKGKWVVTAFNGFFRKHYVYFTATKESPLQKNLYSVDLRNGKILRLTPDHGTHTAKISKSGKYIIDIYSSTEVSRQYKLLNYKRKTLAIIEKDKKPLKDYKLGKMDIFTIPAGNGDDLYCRMIKPVDFDSTKKYPVIVYVYGGPHAQLITDSWLGGAGLFLNYLAENGYLIFTLDNHGSANRGRDFEQVIHRHLGTTEIKDQITGVNFLKTLPYVDTTRIGVHGWSFGGFMTTSLMLRTPGVFKVGVGGGPVIDWKYYEVMYGERYMDTPQENPEGYKEASLLNYVKNLKGHLLLIHGTVDPTVVWQHSLLLIQKAVEENKLIDYFVYPGQPHGVGGKARIHLNRKIKRYFDDYL